MTSPERDPGPFRAAVLTTVLSVGLLVLAVWRGWLGPEVGRGGGFCETGGPWWLLQPANALSNLGFVVAGLAIAHRAGHRRTTITAHPGLAAAYGCLVVLLGPASAAMHATQTALGGHLDLLSMYLVAAFTSGYAAMRLFGRGARFLGIWFVVAVIGCEVIERIPGHVPLFSIWANVAFGALLLLAITGELILWRRNPGTRDLRWGGLAVGALLLAFAIWSQSKSGGPLCDPHSVLQGHAAWHLLDAVAAYATFRLYASERTESSIS